ncbi:cysteine proteinase inhibitor 5-like [Vicia villosa]|uniref:cysteine proteinase inhibitor 5-like n=1 Tax=Vicia villosa TaxID=3911 RepID=UPI00273C71B4|nr:cysteine proteinase inhibitor 5-like [Vicia villosa]
MTIQSFILIVLVVVFSSAAINHATFINPNDPLVNEIGNFAVNEYNKQGNKLKFEKVLSGVSEITPQGTNYRITLSATDGSTSNKYAAIVLDNPTQHVRKLVNFAVIKV